MQLEHEAAAPAVDCRSKRADIPEEEIRQLALQVADARDWGARGRVSLGYATLLRGMVHAENCLLEGKPWAGALVECWRDMIDDYCREYERETDEE